LIVAALLLVARAAATRYALPAPSAEAILTATGASKSRAYEVALKLVALVPALATRAGRPAKPAPPLASADTRRAVARAESRSQALTLLLMSPEFQRR